MTKASQSGPCGIRDRLRWMGEAYQQHYREDPDGPVKKLALVQTPGFVGEFLIGRTLEPALSEFGLEGFRLIDPTCGTGHLLLQAFDSLWDRWTEHAPEMPPLDRARKVLASIAGVDYDPICVAIAKFRLIVAACDAAGVLPYCPITWKLYPRVAWGDSLLPPDSECQPYLRHSSDLVPKYGAYTTRDMADGRAGLNAALAWATMSGDEGDRRIAQGMFGFAAQDPGVLGTPTHYPPPLRPNEE